MDRKGKQGDEMRTRNFRKENYNTRRVFLRSYPLQWGGDDEYNKEDVGRVANGSNQTRPMKKIILSVFHWGGDKVLFLKKFKCKLVVYVIACFRACIKTPTALISA
ncbi:hypothetical protein I3760_05G114000 [Carya illinoinensis]|uniref:Uncharacterized protein n=1 Tax=Carya illinoinensis TaxID=32201 RepID=A0A8T1QHW0_CARIL|nr:hypothetical protein I3760_05G114000 [Carya illinoinensis]KAG6653949.1 hypothetical protein CIPAW_05G112300 [Carya illinoinensis]